MMIVKLLHFSAADLSSLLLPSPAPGRARCCCDEMVVVEVEEKRFEFLFFLPASINQSIGLRHRHSSPFSDYYLHIRNLPQVDQLVVGQLGKALGQFGLRFLGKARRFARARENVDIAVAVAFERRRGACRGERCGSLDRQADGGDVAVVGGHGERSVGAGGLSKGGEFGRRH